MERGRGGRGRGDSHLLERHEGAVALGTATDTPLVRRRLTGGEREAFCRLMCTCWTGLTIYIVSPINLSDWAETSLVRWRLAGASACSACAPGTYTNWTGVGNERFEMTNKEGRLGGEGNYDRAVERVCMIDNKSA